MYQDKDKTFWEPLRWIERVQALPLVQLKTSKKLNLQGAPCHPLRRSTLPKRCNNNLATPATDAAPSIRVASEAGVRLTLFIS